MFSKFDRHMKITAIFSSVLILAVSIAFVANYHAKSFVVKQREGQEDRLPRQKWQK
jgi:hypothetical protein